MVSKEEIQTKLEELAVSAVVMEKLGDSEDLRDTLGEAGISLPED